MRSKRGNFEIGRILHLKSEIRDRKLDWAGRRRPIRYFEISDLRCRIRPISKCLYLIILIVAVSSAFAQVSEPPSLQFARPQGPAAPPPVITLQDALDRAKQVDAPYHLAIADAAVAREDRVQAKSALLPTASHTTQYLGTQGNGRAPSGRFVTNDGVHVYRSWGIVHQDINPNTFYKSSYRRAQAAEALAAAKVEIAQRGLAVTVTRNYYALVTSQRKYATAQQSFQQAQRFLEITQQQENAGQVAHSDVVKAQVQYEQQRQGLQEAMLGMENTRLNLAEIGRASVGKEG